MQNRVFLSFFSTRICFPVFRSHHRMSLCYDFAVCMLLSFRFLLMLLLLLLLHCCFVLAWRKTTGAVFLIWIKCPCFVVQRPETGRHLQCAVPPPHQQGAGFFPGVRHAFIFLFFELFNSFISTIVIVLHVYNYNIFLHPSPGKNNVWFLFSFYKMFTDRLFGFKFSQLYFFSLKVECSHFGSVNKWDIVKIYAEINYIYKNLLCTNEILFT